MLVPLIVILIALADGSGAAHGETASRIVEAGAVVTMISDGYKFTEGPASDSKGNLYFSDYGTDRILTLSPDGTVKVFTEDVSGPIGLYFDSSDNLYVCAAREHRIKVINNDGGMSVFPDRFNGKLFNSPNDIWIDPEGGVYFTDPRFAPLPEEVEQDGLHVYYIPPGGGSIIRAADDLSGPNGLVGTADGRHVYITDTHENKTFVYDVNDDGTLSGKRTFAPEGYDGLTVDTEGNVYITMKKSVEIYSRDGEKIESIQVPGSPTNVCFGGRDRKTLFITARVSLLSIRTRIRGL